jgi:peptide-methionine (S)-S-oxide reductase
VSNERLISKFIPERTLPGREHCVELDGQHHVLGTKMTPPYPESTMSVVFGMGCFWGVERRFWLLPGVYTTSVGYAGGNTPNPTYEEVCSGFTGHTEVVRVVYDEQQISFGKLLSTFWECHDPTQGMRQGNDRGSQYRSAIYCETSDQEMLAYESKNGYQVGLRDAGFAKITTEILIDQTYYFAEDYHQQYLEKNPNGYCAMQGTGVLYRDAGSS